MLKKLLELIPEKHGKLYQEAKKQAERETLLRTIIESIRKTLDIDEIRQNLVNVVGENLKADKCFFWDYDNNKKEFIQQIKFDYVTSPEFKKPYTYGKETDNFLIDTYKKQGYIHIPDFLNLIDDSGHMGIIGRHQINYLGMRTNCCFGLFDGKKFLGAFAVQYKEVTPISNEDIELLKIIVNQTAIALKQAELYSKTKKQAEREKIIREITETALLGLEPSEIQNKLITMVSKVFKADKCFIRPFNNEIDAFDPVEEYAQYCSSPDLKKSYYFSEEVEEFVKSEYKKGVAFIVPDFEEFLAQGELFSAIAKRQIEHYGIKANYCFPIISENNLIGSFVVQFKKKTYLEPEDISLLKTVVNQAAISLKQAEQHQKLQKQIEREVFLRKINEAISETLDLDIILSLVCKEMLKFFNVDRVGIGKYASSEDYSNPIKVTEATANKKIPHHKNATVSTKVNEYLSECLLKKGKDLIINNMVGGSVPEFYRDFHKQLGTKSILNVAIKKGKENWGIMALFQNRDYRNWTHEEIDLMHAISEQIFIAIRQAELYARSQDAARLKNEFITNVSHEIRTPLNAILGFSQLLVTQDYSEEKHQKYLNNISLSANHLLKLVNSILDFSKIESGKMNLFLEEFNCTKIIQEVILSIKSMAIQKNITIKTAFINVFLEADIIKFKQILLNLLSNAIKFTDKNGQITISTKTQKGELIIEVEDDGIGITEEDADKLFKYFRQIDSSHSRNQEGTGLGLALAKKLVELHNGTIGFESKKGKGSKFWFTMPKVKTSTKIAVKN